MFIVSVHCYICVVHRAKPSVLLWLQDGGFSCKYTYQCIIIYAHIVHRIVRVIYINLMLMMLNMYMKNVMMMIVII